MTNADLPQLAGYTLSRPIGRGNTSLVFLGSADAAPEREMAIKVPLGTTLANHTAAERFGNEVRLSLQFRHPHLVRGYAGTAFGPGAYLAMRYFAEGTLAELLEGRVLPYEAALRVLADVTAGVAYLHQQGAVHQDIKTQNVYLSGGRAALGDFGNTYFVSAGGNISGSPFYMAPEIYHGEASSIQSDVYSLGVLCFELLAGVRPHLGNSYEELMISHLTRFPAPVTASNRQVPRTLSRLIELAMAKKSHDRPSSAALRRALLEALGEEDEQVEIEPSELPPAQRSIMGRHQHTDAVPTPRTPGGPSEESPKPQKPGAKSWNPFKRGK
ncbi:serine/threonine protein kinase [Deinococcus psychrotolerans]|uniref:Serine/threonine protein kinase n=1 Tax=Deinococcus psychrotolerans TaxID=2489213 RepID=A0A3G8YE67_9DEIO|nr:serine/threonine-protein kinase [Deinococcus psychrotolerans]AZI43233.1 serine/threonine protein kinase [Deinococcus psychrotolerans]